ncbi:multidrug efflux SMR transporter [Aliiroseovarius sp. Z3]|nr:multidrug efflux SMR transporter [Aliiroseovarius sp. Z3]
MAWIALLIAGLLETAWAAGLKSLSEGFQLGLFIATAVLMIASLGALYWSMRSLPLSVAYPLWTGIGSVGSVVAGYTIFKQDIGVLGMVGVICLIVGMFLISFETH